MAAAFAIAYLLAARLGLALLTKPEDVAVFWPASGIAAGALIAPLLTSVVGLTGALLSVGAVVVAYGLLIQRQGAPSAPAAAGATAPSPVTASA